MATKRTTLKTYDLTVRMNVDLSIRVAAQTLEEALLKGHEVAASYDDLLDASQYEDIQDGSAELIGVWTIDD